MPSSRPITAARRSGGSACSAAEICIRPSIEASSFAHASSVLSPSTIPASARITSPSAQ